MAEDTKKLRPVGEFLTYEYRDTVTVGPGEFTFDLGEATKVLVPESVYTLDDKAKEEATPAEARRNGVMTADVVHLIVNGSLQDEWLQKIDVRAGKEKTRVYARWAVPETGLPWTKNWYGQDEAVGREFQIMAVAESGSTPLMRTMTCIHYAVRQNMNEWPIARAIFECDTQKTREPEQAAGSIQNFAGTVIGAVVEPAKLGETIEPKPLRRSDPFGYSRE